MDEKTTPANPDTDLMGEPYKEPQDPRGRPAFEFTQEKQRLVRAGLAVGVRLVDIARQIGCDEKTIRNHFSDELAEAAELRAQISLEVLASQIEKAVGGNTSAAKFVQDRLDFADAIERAPSGRRAVAGAGEGAGQPAAPIGKKATQQQDAITADEGSAWGDVLRGTGAGRVN